MACRGSGSRDRPEAGGRDCTWPLISTCTAVGKEAPKEADPGNDESTTTGYSHGIWL
jgi:hypothetical protein